MEASDSGGYTEDELRREELDFIERLPEELVAKLLSGFTPIEAARTSLISRRWRNLWKSAYCLVLEFDGMKELHGNDQWSMSEGRIHRKRLPYMKWVNEVFTQLLQHKSNASEFRLAFNFTKDSNSKGDIDRWPLCAVSKRIESLDLSVRRENIKVVEIVGFKGYPAEVEFLEYVMDYFVCLERMVIDRRRPDPLLVNDLTLFGKAGGEPTSNEAQRCTAERAALELKSRAAPSLGFTVI